MKSQAKASPASVALGLEVLKAVLADQLDPRLGEALELLGDDVLGRGQDLDVWPAALAHPLEVARARPRDRCPGSAQASIHARPAWRPVRPASRRWEKKSSGSQLVHRPLDSTGADARAVEQAARDLGQVEHAPGGDPVAEPARTPPAPRRRPRSSRGRSRDRSPRPSRRPPRPRGRRCPPRARASRSAASPRRARRPAPRAGSRRPAPAGSGRGSRSPGRRARPAGAAGSLNGFGLGARSRRSIASPWTWKPNRTPSGVAVERGRQAGAVGAHRVLGVVGVEAEVERLERPAARPADAGRERRPAHRAARPRASAGHRARAIPCPQG